MAKDVVNPDPIPISDEYTIDDKLFNCATFVDGSIKSSSLISTDLMNYLESQYTCSDIGNSTKTFLAQDKTPDNIYGELVDNISSLNNKNVGNHVMCFTDHVNPNDTMIVVSVYPIK